MSAFDRRNECFTSVMLDQDICRHLSSHPPSYKHSLATVNNDFLPIHIKQTMVRSSSNIKNIDSSAKKLPVNSMRMKMKLIIEKKVMYLPPLK